VVLVGIAATWLPWLMYPERTVFQFYTIVIWPFLLLALTFALRRSPERRTRCTSVGWPGSGS
jgi:dolichyl-phosphate-mannose--protein O-mannosyl transferase